MVEDKPTGTYYIGIHKYTKQHQQQLLAHTISPTAYFKHSHATVVDYLQQYSIIYVRNPVVDIMKLHICPDGAYSVLLKTHWIRMIQRHWRNVLKQRQATLRQRRSTASMRGRELHGRYNEGLRGMPSLVGMLSAYRKQPTYAT